MQYFLRNLRYPIKKCIKLEDEERIHYHSSSYFFFIGDIEHPVTVKHHLVQFIITIYSQHWHIHVVAQMMAQIEAHLRIYSICSIKRKIQKLEIHEICNQYLIYKVVDIRGSLSSQDGDAFGGQSINILYFVKLNEKVSKLLAE